MIDTCSLIKEDTFMRITPEVKPISELFPIESALRHQIPTYQRNFSWFNSNIETLFDDISHEDEPYYMGNLLVQKLNDENLYEIVDGQQRMTTISLIFLAIYERLLDIEKESDQEYDNEVSIGIRRDIQRKLVYEGSPRLKLLKRDAEVYDNYLGILDKKTKGRYGNRAFAKRYSFIMSLLSDPEGIHSKKEIIKFYKKLNAVEMLRISVDETSDAFAVFSSLNSKGLPLTLIDLLKTEYLHLALKAGVDSIESVNKWEDLITIFKTESDDPSSIAVTQFLLNNYDAFESGSQASITKRQALKSYIRLFNDNGAKYMDTLIKNAEIFSHITPLVDDDPSIELSDEIVKKIKQLQKLDPTQTYPLLLFALRALDKKTIRETTINSLLTYLIRFYVRRNIVQAPKASNVRAKIIEIIRKVNKNDLDSELMKQVRRTLGSIAPSNTSFGEALDQGVYDVSPQTVRFILISLERHNGSNYFNKQTPDNLDNKSKTKNGKKQLIWTIEHILPETENLKNGWPKMISPSDPEHFEEVHQQYVHKIGNLTLTGYNPEMSDKSFSDKVNYKDNNNNNDLGLRTRLWLNESILDQSSDESWSTKKEWTPKDIERRTEMLKKEIVKLFDLKDV